MSGAFVGAQAESLLRGRYRLVSLIGQGGKAKVFRAHDAQLGRDVAVKIFTAPPTDAADIARQRNELRILAGLNHHGLVSLLDAGVERDADPQESRMYLVMELVTGDTLKTKIAQRRLTKRQIALIGIDLAEGLEYIHQHGVVHRDIKPSNILMVEYSENDQRLRAKLADFGIAVLVDGERWEKDAGSTGTAAYLSPEQARGLPLSPASDVYSLGLVLLECFTGEVAFPGSLIQSAVARLLREPVIPSHIPRDWRQLLTGMTAREPGDRPDLHEVILFLRQAWRSEAGRHRATTSATERDEHNRPTSRRAALTASVLPKSRRTIGPLDSSLLDGSPAATPRPAASAAPVAPVGTVPPASAATAAPAAPARPKPITAKPPKSTAKVTARLGKGSAKAVPVETQAITTPTVPVNEAQRLKAVRRYNVLDTAPEESFDRITALAARIFSVPIAIVSIVDSKRIWFKSHFGIDLSQVSRDSGLCASAILQDHAWIVEDAAKDPRARTNPLVAGEPGIRFYAGIPLHTGDGHNLGMLSILDYEPRSISAQEIATLEDLAAMVMSELELHRVSRRSRRTTVRTAR